LADYIFIYNSNNSFDDIHYVITDKNYKTKTGNSHIGSLSALKSALSGKKIVLITDGTDCTFIQTPLPQKNRKKAIDSIGFKIEDSLNDNIKNLNFINSVVGDNVNTAVSEHNKIEHIVTIYKNNGIKLDVIVPAWDLFPPLLEQITLYQLPDEKMVVCTDKYRLVCPDHAVEFIIDSILSANPKMGIQQYNLKNSGPAIKTTTDSKTYEYNFLEEASAGYANSVVNLIQKKQIELSSFIKSIQFYKLPMIILLIVGLSQIPNYLINLSKIQNKNQAAEQELNKIIIAKFPSLKNKSGKFIKIQQKISKIKEMNSAGLFLTLLNQTIKNGKQIKNFSIQEYKFNANQLQIIFTTDNPISLGDFNKELKKAKLLSEILSIDKKSKKTLVTMRIKKQ